MLAKGRLRANARIARAHHASDSSTIVLIYEIESGL